MQVYDSGRRLAGYFSPLSKAIKEVVAIPVIVTGGITESRWGGSFIFRGKKADLIGVGRAIYKNSDWAKNTMKSLRDN